MYQSKHDNDHDVPKNEAGIGSIDVAGDSEDVDFIAENIRKTISTPLVKTCPNGVKGPENAETFTLVGRCGSDYSLLDFLVLPR